MKLKQKSILLTTLSLTTLLTAVGTSIVTTQQHQISQISHQVSTYGISNNQNGKTIINPDEVFYFSQDLATLDVWDPNGTPIPPTSPNPFDKTFYQIVKMINPNLITAFFQTRATTVNGAPNQTNLTKIENLVKKIETTPNADTQTKQMAKALLEQAKLYIGYKTFEQRWLSSGIDDAQNLWDNGVAKVVAEKFNNITEFSNIKELSELKALIGRWNGLTTTNVDKITQIKAQTIKQTDLLATNSTPSTNDVHLVAGDNFNTLVKIATLDMNINQNYLLEYETQFKTGSATTQSKLVLLNDQGQWKNKSLKDNLITNVDGFGRYDKYESGGSYGSENYPSHQKNFVFKYDAASNQLDLFVRLEKDQVMKNISFNKELGTPKAFGILDVQVANNKSSFGLWQENGQPNGKYNLIQKPNANDINGDQQISKIQFFSTTYRSQRIANPFTKIDAAPNRSLKWWQFATPADQPLLFDINMIKELTGDGRASYDFLKQYINGLPTQQVQQISFGFDGTKPTIINDGKAEYDFFAPLKNTLPETVKVQFPAISKINFKSSVKAKIAKQELSYNDQFYLFGEVASKTNLNINQPLEATMTNPLAKIFYEEPDVYKDAQESEKSQSSTLEALEQADLKLNAVNLMAQVYQMWSEASATPSTKAPIENQNFKLDLPVVKYDERLGIYTNIHTEVEAVILNGPQLYQKLIKYWDPLAKMIKSQFNPDFQGEKRYTVGSIQDSLNIFSQWIVGNFEFIPSYAEVENLINMATKIWNEDDATQDNPNPSINDFTAEHQAQIQAITAQLIKIQFQAIINEFNNQQMLPLYGEFLKFFNSQDQAHQGLKINAPESIFKPITISENYQLISYQNPDNLTNETSVTTKEQLVSLINLLKWSPTIDQPAPYNTNQATINDLPISVGQALFVNPVVINYWNQFSASALMNWTSAQSVETKLQQLQLFNTIFKFFGFDFSSAYVDYLNREDRNEPLKLVFNNIWKPAVKLNLAQVSQATLSLLNVANNKFDPAAGQSYQSYHLDNLIAGANLVRILNHTYLELNTKADPAKPQWTNQEVQAQILAILNQNQATTSEQAAWMKATSSASYDFATLSATLSGRLGETNLIALAQKLATKEVIMAKRILDFIDTDKIAISHAVAIWIISALSVVGLVLIAGSATTIGLKNKAFKFKQQPAQLAILITLIVVGIGALAIGAGVGIPALI